MRLPHVSGELVEVELHATATAPIDAVRKTIRALMIGADLIEHEGKFYVPDGYVAWAVERQGYVKKVIRG